MVGTDVLHGARCVFAALYLRGAPRSSAPSPRSWREVEHLLRLDPTTPSRAAQTLRDGGHADLAIALTERRLLGWAETCLADGHILTILDDDYPPRWKTLPQPPLALWRRGVLPAASTISIVGTRKPTSLHAEFAREIALGQRVVSGGAVGIDSLAMQHAAACWQVLPHGHLDESIVPSVSLAPPWEPFSTANAMERNALIYAASESAIVIGARLGVGGTWHGALTALRRRLTTVYVHDDGSPGSAALAALGGILIGPSSGRSAVPSAAQTGHSSAAPAGRGQPRAQTTN